MAKGKFIIIHPKDNVATALVAADAGDTINIAAEGQSDIQIKLVDSILSGHKVAVQPIAKGQSIIKYGYEIGKATKDILPGEYVHIHNVESTRGRGDL